MFAKKAAILKKWEQFLFEVSSFFKQRGLVCAPTPNLVECPGTEPHLEPFAVQFTAPGIKTKLYLPTSPEMSLKKLLCQDWTDFFEIKTCFRNGELGPHHQPEFTLLEWYRAFYTLEELIGELEDLLQHLQGKNFFNQGAGLLKAKTCSMAGLFKKHLGFSLSPETTKEELITLLKKTGLPFDPKADFEQLFFLLFLNHIESALPFDTPVFILDYPPQLRGFARLNKKTGWADRFELYWGGFELANGFYEVYKAGEQNRLFKEHLAKKRDSVPSDRQLLELMEKGGMPPSSGVALGLDRLFLLSCGKTDIRDIRLFSF